MYFKDKNIFIISPQYWYSREVSKHHYAKELVARGAFVLYLNPISWSPFKFGIKEVDILQNLKVIDILLPFPKTFKFHYTFIYRSLFRYLLKKIKKRYTINVLWNFDNGTYFQEVDLFNDCLKIFQPVDNFDNKTKYNYHHYDIGFSLSQAILEKIPLIKKFYINHGLQKEFILKNIKSSKSAPYSIGYVGNLSIHCLDQNTLYNLVSSYPELSFNFIGDFDKKDQFIDALKNKNNTHFLGLITGTNLFETISQFDILLICYKEVLGYTSDNSHKLLEYLATGNVVVSSFLSSYKGNNLFPMAMKKDNSDYCQLFEETILNFNLWNSHELRKKRQIFALDNTYAKQIIRIDKYLKIHLYIKSNN